MHHSSQRDSLQISHDFSKPLFTGFLELSDGLNSGEYRVTSNKQVTHKQQIYMYKRDVFHNGKASLSLCLNLVDCIHKFLYVQMSVDFFG